ncbi:MAG: hypothetical protein R3250_17855, partial [Melioribacteraceae bacterium]|nr:hypothetical protein [Melioribacteraceae bacterium]
MKKYLFPISILLLVHFFLFCDTTETPETQNSDELGGDPNIPLNTIGNKFTTSFNIMGIPDTSIESSIEIIKNENGIITLKANADLTKVQQLSEINNLIPDSFKDQTGKINTEIKFKSTSAGIQDYFNKDEKLHTLVKYDCTVGDQYQLKKSDGQIITRTVKATNDDFPYGPFLMAKTILIEQDSRIPGVTKIMYRANSTYGLMYVEVLMEDGSFIGSRLFP